MNQPLTALKKNSFHIALVFFLLGGVLFNQIGLKYFHDRHDAHTFQTVKQDKDTYQSHKEHCKICSLDVLFNLFSDSSSFELVVPAEITSFEVQHTMIPFGFISLSQNRAPPITTL
ncbi:hypothetical protein BH10BAC4_BH10BAC4_11570 [soil metagenome]